MHHVETPHATLVVWCVPGVGKQHLHSNKGHVGVGCGEVIYLEYHAARSAQNEGRHPPRSSLRCSLAVDAARSSSIRLRLQPNMPSDRPPAVLDFWYSTRDPVPSRTMLYAPAILKLDAGGSDGRYANRLTHKSCSILKRVFSDETGCLFRYECLTTKTTTEMTTTERVSLLSRYFYLSLCAAMRL